jgi:hypothetical protein
MTAATEEVIRETIAQSDLMGPKKWPSPPNVAAYYGLAGEIVSAIEPHTEADPVAILVQLLVSFGNAVGRGPHFLAEADEHHANLFAVLVGETAKGRKGTSWSQARRVVVMAEENWFECIASGLSSGEGLIWRVRDQIERREAKKEKGQTVVYEDVIIDQGVTDKRCLVFEGEFASALRVLSREGNTLSDQHRRACHQGRVATLSVQYRSGERLRQPFSLGLRSAIKAAARGRSTAGEGSLPSCAKGTRSFALRPQCRRGVA